MARNMEVMSALDDVRTIIGRKIRKLMKRCVKSIKILRNL